MSVVYVVTYFKSQTGLPDSHGVSKIFKDKELAIRFVNKKSKIKYDDKKGIACRFMKIKGKSICIEMGIQEMEVE